MSDYVLTRQALAKRAGKLKELTDDLVEVLEHPRPPLPDDDVRPHANEIVHEAVAVLKLAERLATLVYGEPGGPR